MLKVSVISPESVLFEGEVSSVVHEETVMKEALLNVVTDPKLMVLIVVLSQVFAIAKAIA